MADLQIANLNKNGRESVRIAIREFKGTRNIDIRVYAITADAEMVPTQKGVSVRPTMLGKIIGALIEAQQALIADGTLPTPHEDGVRHG